MDKENVIYILSVCVCVCMYIYILYVYIMKYYLALKKDEILQQYGLVLD